MKKLFLLLSIFLLSGSVHAQIYTDDGGSMAGPPPAQPSRYRLRQNYPMNYPLPPGNGTDNSSDTVEVGRPNYYYPNYGYPAYSYPSGVQSDGDSIYVPGR